jgi:hypothetical protein
MVNYGLNNNAQKIRSVRTLTDREIPIREPLYSRSDSGNRPIGKITPPTLS